MGGPRPTRGDISIVLGYVLKSLDSKIVSGMKEIIVLENVPLQGGLGSLPGTPEGTRRFPPGRPRLQRSLVAGAPTFPRPARAGHPRGCFQVAGHVLECHGFNNCSGITGFMFLENVPSQGMVGSHRNPSGNSLVVFPRGAAAHGAMRLAPVAQRQGPPRPRTRAGVSKGSRHFLESLSFKTHRATGIVV